MKEIGGYFELPGEAVKPYYHEGVYLNSGRNALRYIVQKLGIHKIHVPHYTCPVVYEALKKDCIQVEFYDLNIDLMPTKDFPKNDFILYNNYFGVFGKKVKEIAREYPNLIVDNAQAFYSHQIGRAAFYSPRKFFGLPDGGIACGVLDCASELLKDESWNRMSHLLKRVDLGACAGYEDFKKNSCLLGKQEIKQMSALTTLLLGWVNFEDAAKQRKENFDYLHKELKTSFPLDISDDDVPLVYPFITTDSSMRTKLIRNKIYVAMYWPGISSSCEYRDSLLALPIDQRYGVADMQRICEVLNG
jgi:hypothetical protein